jgi:hypothetical protein
MNSYQMFDTVQYITDRKCAEEAGVQRRKPLTNFVEAFALLPLRRLWLVPFRVRS